MLDARAFLAKAEESLASAEADYEAGRYNSCAHSTYYACFQAVVAALIIEQVVPPRGKWGHEFVQGEFSNRLVYRRKRFNSRFRNLLQVSSRVRMDADYSDHMVGKRVIGDILREARVLVNKVREQTGGNR